MDLISREEAIKEIERFVGYLDEDMITRLKIALMKIPSVQRWIPVTERLPSARESVIISIRNGTTGEGCYRETTKHHIVWNGYRWDATYWDDEVTAWMPLPEPFKEDGGEE